METHRIGLLALVLLFLAGCLNQEHRPQPTESGRPVLVKIVFEPSGGSLATGRAGTQSTPVDPTSLEDLEALAARMLRTRGFVPVALAGLPEGEKARTMARLRDFELGEARETPEGDADERLCLVLHAKKMNVRRSEALVDPPLPDNPPMLFVDTVDARLIDLGTGTLLWENRLWRDSSGTILSLAEQLLTDLP